MEREWRQVEITEGPRKGRRARVRGAFIRDGYEIEYADGTSALTASSGWFRFINLRGVIDTTAMA